MTTKSHGSSERGVKTVVTNNKADKSEHSLEQGCARESMYSHKDCYDGIRQSYPKDSEMGNMMAKYR